MSKVNIKRLDSVTKNDTTATEQINDNFKALQAAIENTVSRDGTVPNYMDADLDLNSYRIINVGDPVGERDVVTLKYFEEKAGGAVEAAAEAKANASKAASSAQSALVASNNAIGQVAKAEGLLIAAEGQLENTKQYVDAAKADIKSAVDEAEMNISDIVTDAEGSITNIAVAEANKAIANAAQEATDTATANVNNYVNSTIKPPLQNYVNQAQEDANSAATSMKQAAISAKAASNYASNASADADNAAESARLAANSAAAAATSKTNAKTSETNAKIWAEGTDAQVQALGGVKSAKGWAEASTNLDYTNITNCITKIPQDIKLELKNGTLTLKAGSKVYVPNGAGKFKVVTISNDLSSNSSWTTNKVMLALNKNYNGFYSFVLENQYSGTTEPSNPNAGTFWYDTTNNLIKRYSGTYWESGQTFPICIANMVSRTGFSSIDQVFYGFGYIGSTAFALPGVKGLIPNGRNTDGSLKNTEFTIDTVKIKTMQDDWTQEQEQFIDASGLYGRMIGDHYYDEVNNYNKRNDGAIMPYCSWGSATLTAGRISNFTPKTSFHAVDYYDYAREVDNTVHKTGNETISGRKTFSGSGIGIVKSGSAIDIQNKNVDLSVTDGSASGTTEIHFIDKNGIIQGIVEHQNRTSGDSVMILAARNHANTKWVTLEAGFNKNDTAFTQAPTPSGSSKSSDIATTAWVRQYGAQLNYSAAITISGTGEKTASVNGVLIGTPIHTNRSEQLKIIIGDKTFFFAPGNSGEDNNHISQCYLPIAKDQSYNVVEINNNVQLLLVPYV
jgi:hypothetical protein